MKQYYESEVLFQLMERDGLNIPSSVPPYEAEIKAYLINQVKQAYPKLTDYEAEWLLYNYTKHLPAEFPISSVSDVTEATFENVVPFAYQNAILKGQTLVNLVTKQAFGGNDILYLSHFKERPFKPGEALTIFVVNPKVSSIHVGLSNVSDNSWYGESEYDVSNIKKILFTVPSDRITNYVGVRVLNSGDSTGFENSLVVLEGNQLHLNIDRYFEGMQSVKMPVLTTTGKNLFDGKVQNGYIDPSNGESNSWSSHFKSINFIKVEPNTSYYLNRPNTFSDTSVLQYYEYDSNKSYLKHGGIYNSGSSFTTSPSTRFIKIAGAWNSASLDSPHSIQLEKGTQATTYEPFKSNILSTSEEVELREIGDVKDTLDLLAGEMTQRIGEIVLDGSENWNSDREFANTCRFSLKIDDMVYYNWQTTITKPPFVKSSTFRSLDLRTEQHDLDIEHLTAFDIGRIVLNISKERLSEFSVNALKSWLSQNPITVQYLLATESIKTVDLKTVNESGESIYFMPLEGTMNVQSSGEIIKPTFDMAVPVEATTQNLASFIELEMGNNNE